MGELTSNGTPKLPVMGVALAAHVDRVARMLVRVRGIGRRRAAELIERRERERAWYVGKALPAWERRVRANPSHAGRRPAEPVVPSFDEAMRIVGDDALQEARPAAFELVARDPRAVEQYHADQIARWRQPDVIVRALGEHPMALVAATRAPVSISTPPSDVRTSAEALWLGVMRRLGPRLDEMIEAHRTQLAAARDPAERRELEERLRTEADELRGTDAWKNWRATVDELGARAATMSTSELAAFKSRRVVPAFNALDLGVRMCVECGGLFAALTRRRAFCSDECGARVRNRGRQKLGNGRSSTDNTVVRQRQALERHLKWHARRPSGLDDVASCLECEKLHAGLSAAERQKERLGTTDDEVRNFLDRDAYQTPDFDENDDEGPADD